MLAEAAKNRIKAATPARLRQVLQPRAGRAYGIGIEKTGTTTLARLFRPSARSAHEPDWIDTVAQMHAHAHGAIGDDAYRQYLCARDRRLWLDLESSCLMSFCARDLAELFPEARFVLTVRDCKSWLKSVINHHKTHKRGDPSMNRWYGLSYRPDAFAYSAHDRVLEAHDLFPLDCFLRYWAGSIDRALTSVPGERLLIVRTHELFDQAQAIARFIGLRAPSQGDGARPANAAQRDHKILEQIDGDYLSERIDALCAPHMQRFFPARAAACQEA